MTRASSTWPTNGTPFDDRKLTEKDLDMAIEQKRRAPRCLGACDDGRAACPHVPLCAGDFKLTPDSEARIAADLRAAADRQFATLAARHPAEFAQHADPALDITRRGDMGENTLRVLTDADGDVIVEVFSPERGAVAAEFCTGIGGGHSPNTRRALLALILAIEKDQAERPLRGDLSYHQ